MSKKTAKPRELARILTETAKNVSSLEFQSLAAHTFKDNSPSEIAAVAKFMSPQLQNLLPRKRLH